MVTPLAGSLDISVLLGRRENPAETPYAQCYRRAVDEGRADQVFFATLERAAGVEVEKVG